MLFEVIRCVRHVTFVLVNMAAFGNRWQGAGGRACADRSCSSHFVVRATALPVQSGRPKSAGFAGGATRAPLPRQRGILPSTLFFPSVKQYCKTETSEMRVNRLAVEKGRGLSTWLSLLSVSSARIAIEFAVVMRFTSRKSSLARVS